METLRLLDLDIDRGAQRVCRDGMALPVHGLSWRLLEVLLAHGDRVVAFDTLAAEVWAPAVVGEDAISQRVKLLRQALGDDGRRPRYVRSVRGRGYQLCAAPVALPATASVRPLRWRWHMAAVLLVAAGVLGVWQPWQSPPAPQGAAQALLERAAYYAGIGQAGNNERAIALYRQALQVDPDSAGARRGLSRALSAQVCLFNGSGDAMQESMTLADAEVQRAPTDAAAHALRGYAYDCMGQMSRAIADYQQALQLAPDDERTRASLAYLHQERGELVRALRENLAIKAPERVRFRDVQVARELELLGFTHAAVQRHARNFQLYPDNVFANIAWPRSLFVSGQPALAEQALAEALRRATPHPQLLRLQGELGLARGDAKAAADAFALASELRPGQSLGQVLAALHAEAAPSAHWIAERLRMTEGQIGDGWPDAALERALLQQARGEAAAAVAELGHAVDAGFRDAAWLQVTPLFADLHAAPGWEALLARIEADVSRQRAQVLAADWRPDDLRALSAAPAAGTR